VSVRIEYLGASTFRQIRLSAQAIQANIDVALSTRAADSTLQSVYNALAQVEQQVSTGDWRLKIRNDEKLANLDIALSTRLDVALSTRAADSTLQSLYNALAQVEQQVATGDWRLKIRNDEKLANLDIPLSTIAGALASKATDSFRVTIVGASIMAPVDIQGDAIGLAKDSTLQSRLPRVLYDSAGNELSPYIKNLDVPLSSIRSRLPWISSYNVISLDLTVARTDAQIASCIQGMAILDPGGAPWSFKLFSTSAPALNVPTDFDRGSIIYGLNCANLYVTNSAAASGTAPAKILVWS